MNAVGFLVRNPCVRLPVVFSFFIRLPAGAMALLLPLLALSIHLSPKVSGASIAVCRFAQNSPRSPRLTA